MSADGFGIICDPANMMMLFPFVCLFYGILQWRFDGADKGFG